MLDEAARTGAIARDGDIDAAVDLMLGAYQSRYISGEPFPAGWEERIVSALLRGLGGHPPG
jgi:hypothetical protein